MKQIEIEASSANTKHVNAKLKFLLDYAKKETIKAAYVCTKTMVAELLTKVLPASRIQEFVYS